MPSMVISFHAVPPLDLAPTPIWLAIECWVVVRLPCLSMIKQRFTWTVNPLQMNSPLAKAIVTYTSPLSEFEFLVEVLTRKQARNPGPVFVNKFCLKSSLVNSLTLVLLSSKDGSLMWVAPNLMATDLSVSTRAYTSWWYPFAIRIFLETKPPIMATDSTPTHKFLTRSCFGFLVFTLFTFPNKVLKNWLVHLKLVESLRIKGKLPIFWWGIYCTVIY